MALGGPNIYPGIAGCNYPACKETSLAGVNAGIADWEEIWSNHSIERWMLAIAEESGEVIGAFNKWHNGYKTTPKTREDLLEEMSQLTACLFLTAYKLQVSPAELLGMTGDFMAAKAAQIREIRRLA